MDLLDALLALSRLDSLPRTGWIQAGVPQPERIAGHVVGVGHIALACSPKVSPGLDLGRTLALALLHDAPECLSGDLPKAASRALPEGAKTSMERSLGRDLLAEFPPEMAEIHGEYLDQTSREARFVKGCDRLQLALECLRLLRTGQSGLGGFIDGLCSEDWSEFPVLEELWKRISRNGLLPPMP